MKHIPLSLTVFVIVCGAGRVGRHADSLPMLVLIWCSLSMETSFHPEPSLIFLLGLPFFSVGRKVGIGVGEGLERVGIVEVLFSLPQVQPSDLKIGILFADKWKPSKLSMDGECGPCYAMFGEVRYERLKPAPVVLVDRPIEISRSSQTHNFLQSCSLCVLLNRNSCFSLIIHWDYSSCPMFSLPVLIFLWKHLQFELISIIIDSNFEIRLEPICIISLWLFQNKILFYLELCSHESCLNLQCSKI